MRVLLLEDDMVLRTAFARRLRQDGHAIDEVTTLAEARRAFWNVDYDGLVLDRIVPDGDSIEWVEELRRADQWVRVLFLSALAESDDRIRGLRAGADDYLPKPVRLDELSLRVMNLLRRDHVGEGEGAVIRLGRVDLDRARREVIIDGAVAHLTPIQYSIFEYLVLHRDRVVSTEELLEHCWDANRDLLNNPLHPQLSRMRSVFGDAVQFVSVRGQGYILRVAGEDASP